MSLAKIDRTDTARGCASVLVVEDDPDIREAFRQLLEEEGFAVRTAENGREGLARVAEMPHPCLILLDLMMPVMDGYEFLRVMHEHDRLAPTPVVVVSAWPREIQLPHRVERIVKKPVDLDLLLELVTEYCASMA